MFNLFRGLSEGVSRVIVREDRLSGVAVFSLAQRLVGRPFRSFRAPPPRRSAWLTKAFTPDLLIRHGGRILGGR
jgi:hypothetical protein